MAYVGKHRNVSVTVTDLDEPGLSREWYASDFEPRTHGLDLSAAKHAKQDENE